MDSREDTLRTNSATVSTTAMDRAGKLPQWSGYVIAVFAEIGLTILLWALRPVFPLADLPIPYILLMMLIGYFFGIGPTILAFILGLLAYIYFFVPPYGMIWTPDRSIAGWARIIGYFIGTALVAFAIAATYQNKKRAEQLALDLETSNRQLTRTLESISDAFVSFDRDWRFTYVNPEAERLLQKPRNELLGKGLWDTFPEDVMSEFKEAGCQAMSSETPTTFEKYWPLTNVWVELHAYPSEEGLSVYANDITDRITAEKVLKETTEKYRGLCESMADWVWEVDTEGRYTYASSQIRDLLGYEPEEVLGKTYLDLMPLDEAERVKKIAGEIIAKQKPIRLLDNTLVHKDGHFVVVQTSGNPVYDIHGDFQGYRGIDRDITVQKRAEEALRESEQKYKNLVETTNTGYVVVDMDGKVVDANAEYLKLTGRTTFEDIWGHSVTEWTADYDKTRNAEEVRKCLETGFVRNLEVDYVSPEGKITPIEINANVVETKAGYRILTLCRDISERKQAEEALRESEKRYRSLIETMNEGFATTDADYIFTYINPRFAEMLGYNLGDVVGHHLFDFLDQENQAILEKQVAERKKGGQKSYELTWTRKDGQKTVALVSPRPVFDEDGKFAGSYAVIADITELKNAEEALRDSERRYRAVVEDQTELICRWLPDGTLTFVNEAYCRFLGKPCSELLEHSFMPFIFEEDRKHVEEYIRSITAENPIRTTEHRVYGLQGEVRWLQWIDRAILDEEGKPIEYQSVGRDITERKRVERELTETRAEVDRRAAELQSTVSSLVDGVALFDMDGKIVFINEAGQNILEIPGDVDFSDWLRQLERYTLENQPLPCTESPAYRALRGEVVRDMRYKLVTSWGKSLIVSASASPVTDAEGRITGATLVFRDQSERVQFEKERQQLLEKEHHIAEMLQQALLPSRQSYDIGRYRITLRYQSGLEEATIGGDFYDVFELGDGKIGVVIGDVAGKGLPAAMRVAAARYAIRSYAYLDPSPAVCLTLANNALSKGNEDDSGMLTAVFAVIDTRDDTLTYTNAGHEPPVVMDQEGNLRELDPTGLALGVMEDLPYGERSIELKPGDMVVMLTDGITEARHDRIIFFDKEGVIAYLAESTTLTPDEIASGLLDAARSHAGGPLQDDAAIVVFGLGNSDSF